MLSDQDGGLLPPDTTTLRRLDQSARRSTLLVFLPVLVALIGVWIATVALTASERRFTIERVTSQLAMTVTTLADFNELAEQATGEAIVKSSEQRTAAIWRALLQYPTASIWVESDGVVAGGQPPADAIDDSIVTDEIRDGFSVH